MGEFIRLLLSPVTCILWLIVGAVAGGLAHQFMGGRSGGFLGDFILGVVGSFVGTFVLGLFGFGPRNGDFGSFLNPVNCVVYVVVSTIGAMIIIALGRMVMGRRI